MGAWMGRLPVGVAELDAVAQEQNSLNEGEQVELAEAYLRLGPDRQQQDDHPCGVAIQHDGLPD